MLAKLKAADAELRAAITDFVAELARPVPDPEALALARFKLGRASNRRRTLVQCLIGTQLHDLPPEPARKIEELRRVSYDMAIRSSEHIARWTLPKARADWVGYRKASARMHALMIKQMDEESAVLYPLLAERGYASSDM